MPTIKIRLNGTDANPWHNLGLTQNPFPQIAKYELIEAMEAIGSLDGDPLTGTADIRSRLEGKGISEELIQLCCDNFCAGQQVPFTITWKD